jgi:hypothetical protein
LRIVGQIPDCLFRPALSFFKYAHSRSLRRAAGSPGSLSLGALGRLLPLLKNLGLGFLLLGLDFAQQ